MTDRQKDTGTILKVLLTDQSQDNLINQNNKDSLKYNMLNNTGVHTDIK